MSRFFGRDDWPWITAGILAGIVTASLVLLLYFRTLNGQSRVAETLVLGDSTAALEAVNGARAPIIGAAELAVDRRLAAVPVDATPLRGPLRINAERIVWLEPDGDRFLTVERATARLRVPGLNRADIVLDNLVATQPLVTLEQTGDTWNFEAVFAELLEPSSSTKPKKTIRVHNALIVDGTVDVTRPALRFAFQSVQAQLPLIVLSEPGIAAPFLTTLMAKADVVRETPAPPIAMEIGAGHFVFPDATARFTVAAASIEDTKLADLSGVWDPTQPGYGVTMNGRALAVNFADFVSMAPEGFPAEGTASFRFDVKPAAGNRTDISLQDILASAGASKATGAVSVRIGVDHFRLLSANLRLDPLALALVEKVTGKTLPYDGTVAGTVTGSGGDISFDLTGTFTADSVRVPFQAGFTGRALITDAGFALQRTTIDVDELPLAALKPVIPGLPLDGTATGSITLTGTPERGPLAVDARFELGLGLAMVSGTIDMTTAVPEYDLNGRVTGVRLADILEPQVPPVSLSAAFSLEGSGIKPDSIDAAIRLDGRFEGWKTMADDTIQLSARIRGGALSVDTLRASLATAELAGSGSWQFAEPQSGAVSYTLSVSSLEPFGPYLPATGDSIAAGSLTASGTLGGRLDRMHLAGRFVGSALRAGAWRAASLDATYDVQLGGTLPVALVEAKGTGIGTATAGEYSQATLSLKLTPPDLILDFKADRVNGGQVEIAATGVLPESGAREIRLQQARVDLIDERWNLETPALVRWTPQGPVEVVGLELRSELSEGRLALDGTLFPLKNLDVQIDVASLPVGDLQRLAGRTAAVEGLVWLGGTIRGGTASMMDLEFRLTNGVVAGVPLQRLDGTVSYADGVTRVAAGLLTDSAGRLDIAATLPSRLQIGLDTIFTLTDGVPVSGTLVAEQFALAPFGALTPRVRDLAGVVNAKVALRGTADQPVVDGTMTLGSGSVFLPDLNQRYTDMAGVIAFDGRQLSFRNLRARSDGWLEVGGQIVLERLDNPVFDMNVTFAGFRPIGVENHVDAALEGVVTLKGEPGTLQLSGQVEVDDGYIVIPQLGGGLSSELMDITRPGPVTGTAAQDNTPGMFSNVAINNLVVTAGPNAWFVAADAEVQLSGDLTVNRSGDNFPITGTLAGSRGQYTLIAGPIVRRFDIIGAQVRFLGTPTPDPILDITARRIVIDGSGTEIDVDVRITGTVDQPKLAVAGGEGAAIAESELLSFLIFGQSNSDLLGGAGLPGQVLLQEAFFGGFAQLLTLEFERYLSDIGLDVFQVRLGSGRKLGGLTTPTLVVGRRLAPDVLLTAETALALLDNTTASINTWAIRLDWTFDRNSRLRLSYEPVFFGRSLRSSGLALPNLGKSLTNQMLIELRRRWTY